MQVVETTTELRTRVADWRRSGDRIAFVPTMGNLHSGHLQLVRRAQLQAERCIASIFVNPLQFGQGEDFDGYPRTLDEDAKQLREIGVDLLFSPAVAAIYPSEMLVHTRVEVPGLSNILCGGSRPGHFAGVATVVCKLFNMVQPDIAVFGEKDFQQLIIIRRMVDDLGIPVEVMGVETQREDDGLAFSSRNAYLDGDERRRAPALYRTLRVAARRIRSGETDFDSIEEDAVKDLRKAGFEPEYCSVRSSVDLSVARSASKDLVIVAAGRLGKARLIDNLRVTLS
jgi:pantoate--beta-alanine ligase